MKYGMEFRPLTRDGFCRCCETHIERNTEKVFVRYSWTLKQPLILCQTCVKEMHDEI